MSNPKLYWQNAGSGAWEDVANWWTDAAATIQADNAPWVNGVDATYLAYDLTLATGAVDSPAISSDIGTGATGSCDIAGINTNVNAIIFDGTFSGDNFTNNFYIFDGTFSGKYFNNNGYIYGGTFTGIYFGNNNTIYGGTFTGIYFGNNNTINDGTFSGNYFVNYDTINDGTFSGNNFVNASFYNNGTIYGGTFSGDSFGNYTTIYDGTFTGDNFNNYGGTIYDGTFSCGDVCECGFQSYDSCGICGGTCSISCCDGTNCGSDYDALGYCNGDATTDCAGNYYSPSNEDGNAFYDLFGNACSDLSLNSIGSFSWCCAAFNSVTPAGVNGQLYSSNLSPTYNSGMFLDYGFDPTGTIHYPFFYGVSDGSLYTGFFNGYWQSGIWVDPSVQTFGYLIWGYDSNDSDSGGFYFYEPWVNNPSSSYNSAGGDGSCGVNGVHYIYQLSLDGRENSYNASVQDYSYTGLDYDSVLDPTFTQQYFFYNGTLLSGGYNGTHYSGSSPDSYTGLDFDYGYDPSGGTQYFFFNGTVATGCYDIGDEGSCWLNGLIDSSITGLYPTLNWAGADFGTYLYIQGHGITSYTGWDGVIYQPGSGTVSASGFFPDAFFDPTLETQYYFVDGSPANGAYATGGDFTYFTSGSVDTSFSGWTAISVADVGGWGFYYFYQGVATTCSVYGVISDPSGSLGYGGLGGSYTGTLFDYGYNEYVSFINGSLIVGGYSGIHYTNGAADTFTGIDIDIYDGLFYIWLNGSSVPMQEVAIVYPDPSDVRSGVNYGWDGGSHTGTLVATSGVPKARIAGLIGLPSILPF